VKFNAFVLTNSGTVVTCNSIEMYVVVLPLHREMIWDAISHTSRALESFTSTALTASVDHRGVVLAVD